MKAIASAPCGNVATVGFLFVMGLLGFVSLAAKNDPARPTRSPDNPAAEVAVLRNSKTLRVTATCYTADTKHRLTPDAAMNITFARPNKFRVEAIDLSGKGHRQEDPDLFVTDGSTVSEYLSGTNRYRICEIPDDRPLRLCHLTDVERKGLTSDMPDGFQRALAPLSGESTTVKSVHLDRKPMLLINRVIPQMPYSSQMVMSRRLWYDWKSGLPIRYERYLVSNGVERICQRIDYTNWQIDRPIPPSTFSWKAPWTARLDAGEEKSGPKSTTTDSSDTVAPPSSPLAADRLNIRRNGTRRMCPHRLAASSPTRMSDTAETPP